MAAVTLTLGWTLLLCWEPPCPPGFVPGFEPGFVPGTMPGVTDGVPTAGTEVFLHPSANIIIVNVITASIIPFLSMTRSFMFVVPFITDHVRS